MIRLYFHHTPNPMKVALLLEETGIPYEVIPVDTFKGEQHKPEFRKINPNGKTPAIVDTEGLGDGPVTVSTATRFCFISPKNPENCSAVPPSAASCCRG